ncbi:MAG TPA: hypothetical protein DDW52_08355 [Planctomycetaceae bacterium]|nr:hypothetical protein [Planctomycetaceae bacterium]
MLIRNWLPPGGGVRPLIVPLPPSLIRSGAGTQWPCSTKGRAEDISAQHDPVALSTRSRTEDESGKSPNSEISADAAAEEKL